MYFEEVWNFSRTFSHNIPKATNHKKLPGIFVALHCFFSFIFDPFSGNAFLTIGPCGAQ